MRAEAPFSESEIREAFKALDPKLREIPVADGNEFWIKTGAFTPGANAPGSRQGQLRSLTDALATWARENRGKTVRAVA